jgi:hypothetical protein
MKRRIALSILAIGCAFCAALGCVDTGAVADDQPIADEPDAGSAGGIGTSPVWWLPWCPPCCGPGPTDTTGVAP